MKRLIGLQKQVQESQLQNIPLDINSFKILQEVPKEYLFYQQDLENILQYTLKQSNIQDPQSQWKYVDTKQGITAHYRKKQQNMEYRGEGILNENIQSLGEMVFNLHEKKQYVEALQEYSSLNVINQSMYIAYIKLKSPIGIQDRDLVTLTGVFKNNEGAIVIIQKSIPYPQKKSPNNTVRANLIFQTWILKKIDDNNTKITLVGSFDPNGSIPQFLKNKVVKDQGFTIQYIKDYLSQQKQIKN